MPILSHTRCNQKFHNRIDAKTQVCAGIGNGKDTCLGKYSIRFILEQFFKNKILKGDSGGPLVVRIEDRWHLVGLTSWGGVNIDFSFLLLKY